MRFKTPIAALLGAAMLACIPASAQAAPIDGTFSMFALFRAVDGATGATADFDEATGIDFLPRAGGDGAFLVTTSSGDFFPELWLEIGSIQDFAFAGPGSANYQNVSSPIVNFETLLSGSNRLTFTLNSIGVQDQNSNVLHLVGTGVFNWAGYDPTPGTFELFGTSGGASLSFNVADGTAAAPVPEPASMVLLGSGALAALAKARRRRRTEAV